MNWLRRLLDRRAPAEAPRIEVTADDLRIHRSSGVIIVKSADVQRILAHKVDRFTTDEIMLRFELDGAADVVPVSEEWPGFHGLLGALATQLGVGESWYLDIMSPAFEPKPRYIYIRSNSS